MWIYRHNLHRGSCKNPKIQRRVEKEFGSIYAHYKEELYFFEIIDLARRLLLTGGLILMGEESVGQIFCGIVVCLGWCFVLVHYRPYKSEWDNIVAITLAAQLTLTLVSGMALKLYAATPGQDSQQRMGFGIVLVTVSVLCVCLSLGTTLASIPCAQHRAEKCRNRQAESGHVDNRVSAEHPHPVMNPLHRQSQKTAPLVRTANKSRPVAHTRNGEDEGCDAREKGPTRKLQTEKLRRKRSVVLRRQPSTSTQVSSSTAI